jgi:hypothetical protein
MNQDDAISIFYKDGCSIDVGNMKTTESQVVEQIIIY